jgi:RNA polymerase sigma factor (sigma-70 family)
VKEGDARLGLYLEHRVALVAYATHLIGSRTDAEDVVQEAFLKFVPDAIEAATSPKNYLFRVVRNLAFDLRRRRAVERRAQEETPDWVEPMPVATPEQQLLFCQDLKRVQTLLAAMPEPVRIAVEMHRHGGFRLEQIARHLGVSVPTVSRMIRNAVARLSDELDRRP